MSWISAAFAILKIITFLIGRYERTVWMNEGERRLIAKQLKEHTNELARALRVEKEIQGLDDAAVLKRAEDEGWIRD